MGKQVRGYGPLEDFEEITYFGKKMWRSKENPNLVVFRDPEVKGGEEDYLYGVAVKGEPTYVERATSFLGGGELPSAPEEQPLTAEFLSLDPEDPRALATLVTDRALADLSAQLAENPELLNQEGMFEQWMNLALIEQGFATDPVMAATATKALGMGYLDMFASGELDDPDKAEEAARMFAQQLQALTGFEEAAAEDIVSPEDELTALYEQQVKDQAEMEQMSFYRAGIMDLVSLAPAEARLGLMAGMLEDPGIAKMFFPKSEPEPRVPWSPETPTGGLPTESKFEIR